MNEHDFITSPNISEIYNLMDWTADFINNNIEITC